MKAWICGVVMGGVVLGCSHEESSAAEGTKSVSERAREAVDRAKGVAEETKAGIAERMREWKGASQDALDRLDARLGEWNAKAKSATGAEKERLEGLVKELGPRREELAKKLEELECAGADAWAKYQPELERMLDEAKRKLDRSK